MAGTIMNRNMLDCLESNYTDLLDHDQLYLDSISTTNATLILFVLCSCSYLFLFITALVRRD